MAGAGAIAAFQNSRGREFRDLFPRNNSSATVKRAAFALGQSAPLSAPILSSQGRKQLERTLSVLVSNGVFAPQYPSAAMLQEAVADYGEPITVVCVLHALDEANYYHPEFRKGQFDRNLAFFSGDSEQYETTIRQQIHDMASLCGIALLASDMNIDIHKDGHTEVRLNLNNKPIKITYQGFKKNLSTVLCVEIAKFFYGLGTGKRLASIWSDQGMFVTAVQDGSLNDLNKDLGDKLTVNARFGWLDEEQPFDRTSMPDFD